MGQKWLGKLLVRETEEMWQRFALVFGCVWLILMCCVFSYFGTFYFSSEAVAATVQACN